MEASRPGLSSDNLWGKIYTVPAAAFPIKTEMVSGVVMQHGLDITILWH